MTEIGEQVTGVASDDQRSDNYRKAGSAGTYLQSGRSRDRRRRPRERGGQQGRERSPVMHVSFAGLGYGGAPEILTF